MRKKPSVSQNHEQLSFLPIACKKQKSNLQAKERRHIIRLVAEVIHGHRSSVKLYSRKLNRHIMIVNEGLVDVSMLSPDEFVVTMDRLSDILSSYEMEENTDLLSLDNLQTTEDTSGI